MKTRPTRHESSLRAFAMFLLHHVESVGISELTLRRKLRLKEKWLESLPESELVSLVPRIVRAAQALTDDKYLCLHAGERFHFCLAGAGGFAAAHAPTPGLALETFGRFINVNGVVEAKAWHDATSVTFEVETMAPWPITVCEQVVDGFLSAMIAAVRPLCGSSFEVVRVRLKRAKPSDARTLERVLRPRVEYGAERDEITLRTEDLRRSSLLYEPLLYEQLRYIADLGNEEPSGTSPLRQLVEQAIRAGDQTIEGAAETLQIGTRTLQRRLQTEGVTFRRVLSEVRVSLAEDLLVGTDLSIAEIARRLNYSDDKALRKALKSLTGRTPSEIRVRSRG